MTGVDQDSQSWRSHALLWESQLSQDDWKSLWGRIRVTVDAAVDRPVQETFQSTFTTRVGLESNAPVRLSESFSWKPSSWDFSEPSWFDDLEVPPDGMVGGWLREAAFRSDMLLLTPDALQIIVQRLADDGHRLGPEAMERILASPRTGSKQARSELSKAVNAIRPE